MIWQKEVLVKYGNSLKLELQNSLEDKSVQVVLPRLPDEKTLKEIEAMIPYEVKFLQRIKLKTLNNIDMIFNQARVEAVKKDNGRDVQFKTESSVENPQELISAVVKEILDDGFYDSWEFVIGGESFKGNQFVIKALATHSVSDKALATHSVSDKSFDNIDLKIMLETCEDVLDFINQI